MTWLFPNRRVGAAVLLPTLLFGIGHGAALPMIAVAATDLGAGLAAAGLLAALPLVGQLLGNLPSGALVARVGEGRAMLIAGWMTALGGGVSLLASTLLMLAVGVFLIGLSAATFAMARQTFVTVRVDYAYRGRAFSTVAGSNRCGMLVGPFAGALVLAFTHSSQSVFAVAVGSAALTIAAVLLIGDIDDEPDVDGEHAGDLTGASIGVLRTAWRSRRTLATVGSGAALLNGMRGSRTTLVPLAGVSIGLTSFEIAVLVGVGAAVDFSLFYLGGYLLDHFGRLIVGVTSMVGFATAFVVLGCTSTVDRAATFLIIVTVSLAVFNSLTSGILATMGADLANPVRPTEFLACWRLTVDLGTASAPTAVAAIVAATSISGAAMITGGFGFLGAVILWRAIPRYLPARSA